MSIDRGMDKDVVYTDNEILLSHRKNKIMPFAATLMDPETVILSEVREGENDIPYIWNLKSDTTELIYKTETDSQN